MKLRNKRLAVIGGGLATLAVVAALVLNAFESNLVFFFTPTEVSQGKAPQGKGFRVGGLVEVGSIKRQPDGVTVEFIVTDTAKTVPVTYRGSLPDLFKEGKGAVVEGRLENGRFIATQVLAKHDENYMPPEAQHAVEQAHKAGATVKQ